MRHPSCTKPVSAAITSNQCPALHGIRRGVDAHIEGFDECKTCFECHRGVAHSLPALYEEDPSAVDGAETGAGE
jgi:hypothetical protein